MSPGQASSTVSRSEAKNRIGIVHADGLAGAGLLQLHAAAELARGQAQERHPVAVVGVHIGLDLEDKAGDFLVAGLHGAARWRPGRAAAAHIAPARPAARRRRNSSAPSRNRPATDGLRDRWPDRSAAGPSRASVTSSSSLASDRRAGPCCRCAVPPPPSSKGTNSSVCRSSTPLKFSPMPAGHIIGAVSICSWSDNLVQQFEGIARLAVHLVDEGHDGNVAQAADLEQLAGLGLDALGGVDHHHGAESAAVRVR